MTEHLWSKFWWQDHNDDAGLKMVSFAAQGLWVRLLGEMHKSEREGHLLINGIAPTVAQISRVVGGSEREVVKLLAELEQARVFSRDDTDVIYSRRMVRDKGKREKGREDGKRGGNPSLKAKDEGGLTPPDNSEDKTPPYALDTEADTEAEAEKKEAPPSLRSGGPPQPAAKGSRLPDAWLPSEPDLPASHGADPAETLAAFRDHYRAKSGAGAQMRDWDAAWRNWCRKIKDFRRSGGGVVPLKTSQLPVPDQNAELIRLMQRARADAEPQPVQPLRLVQ